MSKINIEKIFPKKLATPKKMKYEFDPHIWDESGMTPPKTQEQINEEKLEARMEEDEKIWFDKLDAASASIPPLNILKTKTIKELRNMAFNSGLLIQYLVDGKYVMKDQNMLILNLDKRRNHKYNRFPTKKTIIF